MWSALAVLSQAAQRWWEVPPGPVDVSGPCFCHSLAGCSFGVFVSTPLLLALEVTGSGQVLVRVTGVALQHHSKTFQQTEPTCLSPAWPCTGAPDSARALLCSWRAEASSLPGHSGSPQPLVPKGAWRTQPVAHLGLEFSECEPAREASVYGDGTPALRRSEGGHCRELGRGCWSPQAPPRAGDSDRNWHLLTPSSGPQQQRKTLGDTDCGGARGVRSSAPMGGG